MGGVKFPRPVDVEASSGMRLDFWQRLEERERWRSMRETRLPSSGGGERGKEGGGEERGGGGKWGEGGWVGRRVIE